jgi:hypothetical protein
MPPKKLIWKFNVHGSVHRTNYSDIRISNKMQRYTVYFILKLLYMFRVVLPPIVRSGNNCIYSIWYLSHRYCYLPLQRQVVVTVWQIPDAVDTVVCAPDNGWLYHPKHVEQFLASCSIYIRVTQKKFWKFMSSLFMGSYVVLQINFVKMC